MNRLGKLFAQLSPRGFSGRSNSGRHTVDASKSDVIRSGGRSSYIGFGKFEGMGSEIGSIQKGLDHLRELLKAHMTMPASLEQQREACRYHHDIAMCHHRSGDIESALREYKLVVDKFEKLMHETAETPDNRVMLRRVRFDFSSALSGLSVALADKGEDAVALEHAAKALEIRKAIMGANHASVAECLNNLGGLYFRQSSFNKAAEVYQESLRILLTKTEGKEENKYVALAYYNIGLTYCELGIRKGVDAIRKAHLIAEHVWGPNHDQTIQIRASLEEKTSKG